MACSMLSEAKKEIKRKQAELYKYYESTEDCLNFMDDKVRALLEQDIGDLKTKIAFHKRNLKKEEYTVLVAGERCLEKRNLLNLIIEEELFPPFVVSTSSTILELKYGTAPRLVAHKHSGAEVVSVTLLESESLETLQRSCLQQLLSTIFGDVGEESSKDLLYDKIELILPQLKEGVVIVDIVGTYESPSINDKAKAYLLEASAFICIINGINGEGIHRDKVEKYVEHTEQVIVFLDQQMKSLPTCPLLVLSKWDQVLPHEADKIKSCIVKHLTERWPSEDPKSQIVCISSSSNSNAQIPREASDDVTSASLMNDISSMVLKSIEINLEKQWRWLYHLLSRLVYRTKAELLKVKKAVTEMDRLNESQQCAVDKELQECLNNTTVKDVAARELSKLLNSPELLQYFTSWSLDNVPDVGGDWAVTEVNIQTALAKRLQEKIEEWEKQTHVFSESRTLLTQNLLQYFSCVEKKSKVVQSSPKADSGANSSSSGPQTSRSFSLSVTETAVMGVTSPIWAPVAIVALLVSAPVIGTMAAKEKLDNRSKTKEYKKDKCKFMAKVSQEYLTKMADRQQVISLVEEQLKSDKLLLQQKRLLQDAKDSYLKTSDLRRGMADFGIKEVSTMDISCEDLEWKDDRESSLGNGAFATVYRGTLKLQEEGKSVDVALKVWKKALSSGTAVTFLSETDTLRKLDHPFIVKLYGATLLKEKGESRPILVMELCK
ncbi:uncharacterized protein LOC111335523 isoform X1 [Stylophora pistillata]|uniref:uncharacterized protein LOC111335523 isoform X1 n=1 Tax=Stylophora pistillata TaxID=50429 RepID=UPI000C03ADAA|nr:uncharacterized protein LOC111335523 isoform X1 [Stylophora pistillata]